MAKFLYYDGYLGLEALLNKYSENVKAHGTTSGTVTLNYNDGNVHELTTSGNVTIAFSNWESSGTACLITLFVHQGATAYDFTWDSSISWVGGEAPDMSTTSDTTIISFVTIDGGTTVYGSLAGKA